MADVSQRCNRKRITADVRACTLAVMASLYAPAAFAQGQLQDPLQAQVQTATRGPTPVQAPLPKPEPAVQALRIAAEELAILLAGTGYYFVQHDVNSADWTYDYSWSTLQAKLTGEGYAFDTNYFRTNTAAHTGAGTLYYLAARGNGMGVLSSLGVGIAASAMWELLAEFRERISLNDMMVTPFGGAAFGESMAQVGGLFTGPCAVVRSPVLHAVFAPSHALHAWLDAIEHHVVTSCKSTPLSGRALRLMGGTAFSGGQSRTGGQGWFVLRGEARVLDLPKDQSPRQWHTFSDGNWARLNLRTAIGVERLQDIEVTARSVPLGAWYEGAERNTRATVGVGLGIVYSEHAYERLPERADPLFVLELPAFAFSYQLAHGPHQGDFTLVAATAFAEVGTFAWSAYARDHDVELLTPISASKRYNHAFGLVLAPEVRWSAPLHELTVSARIDRFVPVLQDIGDELRSSNVKGHEYRRHLRTALAVGSDSRFRFRGEFDVTQRRGTLGSASRSIVETVWTTGLEARF